MTEQKEAPPYHFQTTKEIANKEGVSPLYHWKIRLQSALLMVLAFPFVLVWGTLSSLISGVIYLFRGPRIRRRSLPEVVEERKSNKEIADTLRKIPFRTRWIPQRLTTTLAYLPDMINYLLDSKKPTRCTFYHYPDSFVEIQLTLTQNIKHQITLGRHPGEPRPTIILIHGLFNTKNHAMQHRIALYIYEKMGYNVVIPDLRDFGVTSDINQAPIFGSYQEGQDMVELAKQLKQDFGAKSVGLLGYSFGGATAMQAAYHNDGTIDGGIVSFNGFAHMESAINYIDTKPPFLDEFFPVYLFFKWTFISRIREKYGNQKINNFHDYINKVVLPYYGGNKNDFFHKNSVIYKAKFIESPLLVIHAEDDPVVLVEHAQYMKAMSQRNPNIQVITTSSGGHYGYWILAPHWLHQVINNFFQYWNEDN